MDKDKHDKKGKDKHKDKKDEGKKGGLLGKFKKPHKDSKSKLESPDGSSTAGPPTGGEGLDGQVVSSVVQSDPCLLGHSLDCPVCTVRLLKPWCGRQCNHMHAC